MQFWCNIVVYDLCAQLFSANILKNISLLKSTGLLNNHISFTLKTKSGYSSDNVPSLVMLIGFSFIVHLNLMTPPELQELCIKLALLSSLHFHSRYWLYRVRFSLKYNLTSGWNASELPIFLRSIFLFSAS